MTTTQDQLNFVNIVSEPHVMTAMPNMYLDGTYKAKFPGWHIEDSAHKAAVILQAINRCQLSPHSVMEIGCGAGEILNVLYSRMEGLVSFRGYDISPDAYDLCKSREKDRLTFANEDILESKSHPRFDVVLCVDVFEHVENYVDFLRKLRGFGEYKIFRIPLDLNAKAVVTNNYWNSRRRYGHLHYFTKEFILQVLTELDYVIVDSFFDAVVLQTKATSPKNWVVNVLNRAVFRMNQDLAARIFGGYFLVVTTK